MKNTDKSSRLKKVGTWLAVILLILLLLRIPFVKKAVEKVIEPILPGAVNLVNDFLTTIVVILLAIVLITIATFVGPVLAAVLWIAALSMIAVNIYSTWIKGPKQMNTEKDAITAAATKEAAVGELILPGAVNVAGKPNKESRSIWV